MDRGVMTFGVAAALALSGCSGESEAAGGPATPPMGSVPPTVSGTPTAGTGGALFTTRPNPAGGTALCDASQAVYSKHGNGTQVHVVLAGPVDVSAEVDGKGGPLKSTGFLVPQGVGGHVFQFPAIPFSKVTGVAVAASGDAGSGSCMAARNG